MDAVLTATNPQTGARLAKIDGQWTPIDATATNPETGERLYQKDGAWKSFPSKAATAPASATQSDSESPKQRILLAADQAAHESGKLFDGIGEAALNTATGIGSSIVGGWRGLATLAKGGSLDDAAKAVQDTQQDYTYQPKTGIGKLATEAIALPLNIAKTAGGSIGGDIGRVINGEKGRIAGEAIGNIVPDVAATLFGGRAAISGASKFAGKSPVADVAPVEPATVAPSINYDVPAFVRNGRKPTPEQPKPPTLPASDSIQAAKSPLEAYAEQQTPSPYGTLPMTEVAQTPRAAINDVAHSPLDRYASDLEHPPKVYAPLTEIDQFIQNTRRDVVPEKSPLDSFIAGEPIPQIKTPATIAGATDDIQAVLKAVGGDAAPAAPSPIGSPFKAGNSQISAVQVDTPAPAMALDAAQRMQILRDVGLENIRKSAIEGNKEAGAIQYQLGKFTSEPAGMAAFDLFNEEKNALANHTQRIIDGTKGVSGLDEQSMQIKGQTIAAPYDEARRYFEAAKKNLYDVAEKRAAESGVPVKTDSIDALLANPDFEATLVSLNKEGLYKKIQSQYERFKALGPSGRMTVANAELYRKWLNAVWSPDNSSFLAAVKNALDQDVFKSAGEDVYSAARQMHQLEKKTLDDPNGISKLMDSDPYTPINRATPYNKIPDAIVNLSPDQFKHIVDTYRSLPDELQPLAQRAIDTIKAHYGDRFLQTGTETRAGFDRQIWNGPGVGKFMENNSAKLPMIFTAPEEIAAIENLRAAGDILHVNPQYPGASAQAAAAVKHGLMTRSIAGAGAAVGGTAAGAAGGPFLGGIGAWMGKAIGSKISDHFGERKALDQFKKGIIPSSQKAVSNPIHNATAILNAPDVNSAINEAYKVAQGR